MHLVGKRTLLLLALAAGYALFLSRFVEANAGGADSSGYLSFGRLLASGRIIASVRTIPGYSLPREHAYFYCPLGFKPGPGGKGLVSNFPPGLPLMFAAASKVVGWAGAARWVMLANIFLGIALMAVFCDQLGLSPAGTVCATGVLAASPATLLVAVQPLSDLPAMTWVLLSVVSALSSRKNPWVNVLTGVAFAMAFLIRPTCVLILPTLLVLFLLPWGGDSLPLLSGAPGNRAWRSSKLAVSAANLAWFSLGSVPIFLANCVFASRAYGHPFATAYGDSGYLFSSGNVVPSILSFLKYTPLIFSPLVLIAPACPFVPGLELRKKVALAGPVLLYLAFYAGYAGTSEHWWSLRFILPVAPMLIAGGVLALDGLLWPTLREGLTVVRRTGARHLGGNRFAWGAAAVFLGAFTVCVSRFNRAAGFMNSGLTDSGYRVAAERIQALVPPNSVCLCMQTSGSLYYYTNLTLVRSDQFDIERAKSFFGWARGAGVLVYASLFDWEEDQVRLLPISGHWRLVAESKPVTIWKWSP
jgi:hypothetical protein